MLEIMLPTVFPVQAQVPIQAHVQAQIQAPVAVPVVVNTPTVVDVPLVAAGVQPPVTMEVVEENDNEILKRLFLTKEDNDDEMEVAAPNVVVVKTEAPEALIDDRQRSSRLERRGLRKNDVIPDKEAPKVIADNDMDMAEDTSVGAVKTVESLTSDEAFEMAEQAIAESDAAIAANQDVIDNFYNV